MKACLELGANPVNGHRPGVLVGFGDSSPQPVDSDPSGPVLAPDIHDVLVPVKPTVRHGPRSS